MEKTHAKPSRLTGGLFGSFEKKSRCFKKNAISILDFGLP
jgi:hypothetical protein